MPFNSGLQVASSAPLHGVPGVYRVGPEQGQLAAVLNDSARLCHLHGMAKLGKDCFVRGVDNSSGADLQRDVRAFEAVAIDLGGQVLVPLILHVPGCQGWLSKDKKGKYKRTMKRTQKASRLNPMN